MENNDELNIQELIENYKEHLGAQASEIVVLKTVINRLQKELTELKSSDKKNTK